MRVDIVNGPNLNLLGIRQENIYGKTCFLQIRKLLLSKFCKLDVNIIIYQSNSESKLIRFIQKSNADYFIINMAGYSYSSVSILDSLLYKNKPYIEVHISNIFNRESFRSKSIFTKYSEGIIAGFGYYVYYLSIYYILIKHYSI
ncbi:3-dehydroquinate dehydratase [Candidatus Vidania fulgoroideae]|uniref:3-dehydroquinate dehydratase n=1 Tax=Candidatus Vidania fulgoroideorum TaxID=881286 RepID=A0A974X7F3_9PROT|nr:3-dehydroquinate dehydratase [Candidatus Vidania fulgoroideae]